MGRIDYPDGSSYDGQWEDDMMHGYGQYLDSDGILWNGIFVNNTFESKIQKKLQTERKVLLRIKEFEDSASVYFKKFFDAFEASDKKTMKDNLAPFFTRPDELLNFVSDPFPKYEDKPADQWNDAFRKLVGTGDCECHALARTSDAKIIKHERLLVDQLNEAPGGQIVEFFRKLEPKSI